MGVSGCWHLGLGGNHEVAFGQFGFEVSEIIGGDVKWGEALRWGHGEETGEDTAVRGLKISVNVYCPLFPPFLNGCVRCQGGCSV